MECEGNACNVTEVVWDDAESGYWVKNHGNRPILVSLTSSSGELCLRLRPGARSVVRVADFDLPYSASFCD